MKETLVHRTREVTLKDPILVEGLPGVGHVGKLVADHIVEELKAEKIMEIYSPHFPPQVIVKEDGTIKQVRNEIYAYKGNGEEPDLLILIGDYQSATNEGHYELTSIFLDIAQSFKVKRIYALGGYGTGQFVRQTHRHGCGHTDRASGRDEAAGCYLPRKRTRRRYHRRLRATSRDGST